MNFKFWKKEKRTSLSQEDIDNMMPSVSGGLLSGLFGNNISPTSLSAVFSAVEMISNSIAELPIKVKTRKEGKVLIVDNHIVNKIFETCELTKFMLLKNLVTDVLLHGDGLVYISRNAKGEPVKLHYCPWGSYTIYRHNNNIGEERTIYKLNNLKTSKNVEDINVIHIFKNSENGYSGKGVLDYADKSIKLAAYAEKSASNFFLSGCHVAGVLSTAQTTLPKKVKQDIREAWREAHGGGNANGVAILEAGMTYAPVTANSRDAQLLESRLFSLQEIARYFNINPTLLGDLSKSSYSTIESANLEFVTHTLMPFITLIEEELKRKLLMPYETELYIDLDEGYLIRGDKAGTASYLSTLVANGILTRNEARQQLGYNAVEDGDNLVIPFTKIEDNTVGKLDKNNDDESNE